jgi:glycosyltransferase involved in cell wall biosynthesis
MTVAHFLTPTCTPSPGGLEASLERITRLLRSASVDCVIHVRSRQAPPGVPGVNDLSVARDVWDAPIINIAEPRRLIAERCRLDFLLLRNAIDDSMRQRPHDPHVIVSFFLRQEAFIAQQVAEDLGIPHIATVRGTDFSRGFHAPDSAASITYVVERCNLMVTTNHEQADTFSRSFNRSDIATIHGSIAEDHGPPWKRRAAHPAIHLVSDSGLSFKKGTHVLVDSAARVAVAGLPVKLTLAGDVESNESAYWERRICEWQSSRGLEFELAGRMTHSEIGELLSDSDIYCSATLGEGCSLARSRALIKGIPIVSTRCGELADVAGDVSHVRLARPGDSESFHILLEKACREMQGDGIYVDADRVQEWRVHFSPAREQRQWLEAVERVVHP